MILKRITALPQLRGFCNSMKLWVIPCRATQDRWVTVKSSDKMWSSGGRNDKPLQYSYRENPMSCMNTQKDATREDEPQDGNVPSMILGKNRGQSWIAPERMKRLGQRGKDTQLWMCLVVKVKSDAVKNNTLKRVTLRTSLVVQWLRLHLSMQGLWVWIPDVWARIPHALGPKTKN